jgi:hypothetical protein
MRVRRGVFLGALGLHLVFALCVCLQETFWLVGRGLTNSSSAGKRLADAGEHGAAAAVGRRLPRSHAIRHAIQTYLHAAGIESGYGFFAPNVPDTYKLVFELHYADGRVEYEPAGVDTGEVGLRFASLMDYIGRTSSDLEREVLVKLLARSTASQHRGVVKIRAILGSLALPDPAEFQVNRSAIYQFRHAYDFVRSAEEEK